MDKWGAPLYGDPCRECGFTWASGYAGSVSILQNMPDDVEQLVSKATGTETLTELGWNVSGYLAHMTDNTRIWAERLIAVARGADAHVVPYDPDVLAEARHYNEISLQGATWSFRIAVANWLAAVEEAAPAGVAILHSERGAMDLGDVAASNAHDAFHHCWDLRRILHPESSQSAESAPVK